MSALTLFDGISGLVFTVDVPLDANVSQLKESVAARTGIEAKSQVILFDGVPPAPKALVSTVLSELKGPIFVFDRAKIAKKEFQSITISEERENIRPVYASLPDLATESELQEYITSLVQSVRTNCHTRHLLICEHVKQQEIQVQGLRMALQNLDRTIKRDIVQNAEFEETSDRLQAQMDILFPEFEKTILKALRDIPLHPSHSAEVGAKNLAELLGEENEKKLFNSHSHTRTEWNLRKAELKKVHSDTCLEANQLREKGIIVSHSCDQLISQSDIIVKQVQDILAQGKGEEHEIDFSTLVRLDAESATVLTHCLSAQNKLTRACSKLLFEVLTLQSQIRQHDVRRSAQSLVSARLYEYVLYLQSLQRVPKLYDECLQEFSRRRAFESKVMNSIEKFRLGHQQDVLAETNRRVEFEHRVPRDVSFRLFPCFQNQPLRLDFQLSPTLPAFDITFPSATNATDSTQEPQQQQQQQLQLELQQQQQQQSVAPPDTANPVLTTTTAAQVDAVLSSQPQTVCDQCGSYTQRLLEMEQRVQSLEAALEIKTHMLETEKKRVEEWRSRFEAILVDSKKRKDEHDVRERDLLSKLGEAMLASQHFESNLQHTSDQSTSVIEQQQIQISRLTNQIRQLQGQLSEPVVSAIPAESPNLERYEQFVAAANSFIVQLNSFALDLGLHTSHSTRSQFPDFNDAIRVVQEIVLTTTRPPPQLPLISFRGAESPVHSIVIFHRSLAVRPFAAISAPYTIPAFISPESCHHLTQLITPQAHYIVGRVVETELKVAVSPNQLNLDAGTRFGQLTVEILQIDDNPLNL